MWVIKFIVFSFFSLFIATLVLLVYPVDYKQRLSFYILKFWTNTTLFLLGVKVIVYGKENIVTGTGKVYVSNHASYLDIFVLLAKTPDNIRMIYRKEINKVIFISWAMRACKFVPIDRDNARRAMGALDKAANNIKKGLSYIIFPEGTRSIDGSIAEFKRGMFLLIEKSGAEIIPVTMTHTNELLPRDSYRIKPGQVNLIFGKPVQYRREKAFAEELRQIVISNIKK
jgi:1-acyl-sn-glycerol-3-phosphate acyltransferase